MSVLSSPKCSGIIGHLFWLGTQALDIGAMTVGFGRFASAKPLDMFENCAARLTLNYYRIGGVDSDFNALISVTPEGLPHTFPDKVNEYNQLLDVQPASGSGARKISR